MTPDLTDEEINRICAGYRQSAAQVRYLRSLGLIVARKPNGRPLVSRRNFEDVRSQAPEKAANDQVEPAWSR